MSLVILRCPQRSNSYLGVEYCMGEPPPERRCGEQPSGSVTGLSPLAVDLFNVWNETGPRELHVLGGL